jgi:hypothetical protein
VVNAHSEQLAWPKFCHPVDQARLWIGDIPLYDWQIDILIAAAEPHSRALSSLANEAGKTSILGKVFLLSIAAAFPGAKCYATSGNEEQLRLQLFALLKAVADRYEWTVTVSNMQITLPNGSSIVCSVKRDADSVEGVHGYVDPHTGRYCPVAYFLDECKHIENAKEQAVRRIDPDFYLGVSTPPTENTASMNWFWNGINYDDLTTVTRRRRLDLGRPHDPSSVYERKLDGWYTPDPIHAFPGEYFTYRRVVTWEEMPHLHTEKKKQERLNLEKKYGKKSAFIRSMLYGEASAGEVEYPIYSEDEIAAMRLAMTPNDDFKPQHGDIRSAADVSQTGESDPMILMLRTGTEIMHISEHPGMDDQMQADYLVSFARKINIAPYQFTIDGGGVGASIANRMEQTLKFGGLTRFLCNNNPTFDFQFQDRYTELHWTIKDLLTYKVLKLPWCPNLLRDMRERQYVVMPGDKIKTEPKPKHRERTGHSPDYLDTIIYLFSDFPIDRIRRGIAIGKIATPQNFPHETKLAMERPGQQIKPHIMPGLRALPSLAELRTAALRK